MIFNQQMKKILNVNDVQKLREKTGAGIMECHQALKLANGDWEKAVKIIHEMGLVKVEKKTSRQTGAGLLTSYIHNERIGVLLELRCETDFVARSEEFKKIAHELTMQIAALNPIDEEMLLLQSYIKDETQSAGDLIKKAIAKFGENIKIARFSRFEL